MDKAILQQLYNRFRNPIDGAMQFVLSACNGKPSPQQINALREVSREGSKVAIASGTSTGKSRLAAWVILWAVSCWADSNTVATAPKYEQLKDIIWKEINLVAGDMEPWFLDKIDIGSDSVRFTGSPETQFAVARTAARNNPAALQGWHANHLFFVIEEAAGIADEIFGAAQGSFARGDVRVLMIGNPTRPEGFYFEAFHGQRSKWTPLHWSSLDSPWCPPDYAQNIADQYGIDSDFYRSRVLGQFPKNKIDGMIALDLIKPAMGRILHPTEYNFAPICLGVDTAWFGDDSNCIYMRQGLAMWRLGEWRKIDTVDMAGRVVRFYNSYSADAVFIDAGGPAAGGIIDQCRRLGCPAIPIDFSGASSKHQYLNKRAEMWADTAAWLRGGGSLPNLPEIEKDLSGPLYMYTDKGKIQMESKKDMRKRGLESPNNGDAIALTFAHPVLRRNDSGAAATAPAYEYTPGKG